jgi:hypothetical protein
MFSYPFESGALIKKPVVGLVSGVPKLLGCEEPWDPEAITDKLSM